MVFNNLHLTGRFWYPPKLHKDIKDRCAPSVISEMRKITVYVLEHVFIPLDKAHDLRHIIPDEFDL